MTSSELVRLHAARAPNLMWLLGAGASATSGIPTAGDMIWDFKRSLYCTEQKVSVRLCEDIYDPNLQKKIQQFCDSTDRFSSAGSESEYAEYFSAVYPEEADRRRYIERLIRQGSPSFGHMALAAMMLSKRVRVVWTTNFDRNIEDAAARMFKTTTNLSVAALDHADLAMQCLNEERWPLLVKLHGDFSSRRLKNTAEELHTQDEKLRASLIDACRRNGLVIAGYSGRDQSIMDTLEECIRVEGAFPGGLFWIVRPNTKPYERVQKVIDFAKSRGVAAELVEANGFDELLGDILLLERNLPEEIQKLMDSARPRISDAPIPPLKGEWPIIRLNALPITSYPLICRKFSCDIGGAKEVRDRVVESGGRILAGRRKAGVIGFGADGDLREAFADFSPRDFDIHSIESRRLGYDSVELGLIYDGLCRALSRERGLIIARRHQAHMLAINPEYVGAELYVPLKRAAGALSGVIPGGDERWSEAVLIHLEYRVNQLWLLFEPTVWVESPPNKLMNDNAKEFQRKRAAGRYNQKWNLMLEGWQYIITGGEKQTSLAAFGIADGVDAKFQIHSTTGFSWRMTRK